jgi:hypothetical protein
MNVDSLSCIPRLVAYSSSVAPFLAYEHLPNSISLQSYLKSQEDVQKDNVYRKLELARRWGVQLLRLVRHVYMDLSASLNGFSLLHPQHLLVTRDGHLVLKSLRHIVALTKEHTTTESQALEQIGTLLVRLVCGGTNFIVTSDRKEDRQERVTFDVYVSLCRQYGFASSEFLGSDSVFSEFLVFVNACFEPVSSKCSSDEMLGLRFFRQCVQDGESKYLLHDVDDMKEELSPSWYLCGTYLNFVEEREEKGEEEVVLSIACSEISEEPRDALRVVRYLEQLVHLYENKIFHTEDHAAVLSRCLKKITIDGERVGIRLLMRYLRAIVSLGRQGHKQLFDPVLRASLDSNAEMLTSYRLATLDSSSREWIALPGLSIDGIEEIAHLDVLVPVDEHIPLKPFVRNLSRLTKDQVSHSILELISNLPSRLFGDALRSFDKELRREMLDFALRFLDTTFTTRVVVSPFSSLDVVESLGFLLSSESGSQEVCLCVCCRSSLKFLPSITTSLSLLSLVDSLTHK